MSWCCLKFGPTKAAHNRLSTRTQRVGSVEVSRIRWPRTEIGAVSKISPHEIFTAEIVPRQTPPPPPSFSTQLLLIPSALTDACGKSGAVINGSVLTPLSASSPLYLQPKVVAAEEGGFGHRNRSAPPASTPAPPNHLRSGVGGRDALENGGGYPRPQGRPAYGQPLSP